MAMDTKVSTVRMQIYNMLREDICHGKYEPGARLLETELAEKYGVSRSPIREVLRLLVADGLVEDIPNCGAFVREFSIKEIMDLFEFRLVLETYAIESLKSKLTSDGIIALNECLAALKRYHSEGNLEDYRSEDEKLHKLIVSLSGNTLVIDAYEKLGFQLARFRRYSLVDEGRFQESVREHESIVNAILLFDSERACNTNRVHITLAKDAVLAHVDSNRRT